MLAGLMAVASVAGPMVVSASTLQTSGEFLHYKMGKWTSSGIEYNPYDRTDWFGEWTLDGQVVWCVEPSVTTSTGVEYDSAGDGAIRNGMTVRSIGQTTQNVEPYYVKRASFFTWLIYKASDDEIAQIKDAVKNEAYSAKFVSNIDYVRRLSKNAKWTATQLLIWYTITSVIAHDFQGASDELSSVFYWYATSDGEGIDKQLYTPFRDVYDKLEANNLIEYTGGFRVYDPSSGYEQRQISNGGNFKLIEKKYGIKVRKEFSDITNGVSGKPNFNPSGIKVGVYSDMNATTKVGELVIGPNGESNTIEVKAGTYYGFELDVNGNPVKDSAKEVVADGSADRGYVSGKDKDSNNKYVTWNVKGNTTDAVVSTFVNTPEVVNFTFNKELADDAIKGLEGLDSQYSREGAVYTVFTDEKATKPVTKNGQPVTATVAKDGSAQFNDLYRGVYYVKETSVPTVVKNGRNIKRFALDSRVYKIDLSSSNDNETFTTDSTVTPTKEYTKTKAFVSNERLLPAKAKGSLIIKKKDAQSNSNVAQGQATLADAEFKVEFYDAYSLGTQSPIKKWEAVYKTDANGEIDVRNRQQMVSTTNTDAMNKMFAAYEKSKEWGAFDYRVIETKAPNGYKLDSTAKDFVVKDGNAEFVNEWSYDDASFLNNDLELHLIKTQKASGDWLPTEEAKKVVIKDARFELTNKATGQKFEATTDDKGKLHFDGVIAGEYTLREVGAKKYKINGQEIDITVAQKEGTTKLQASSKTAPTEDDGAINITETSNKDILVEVEDATLNTKAKLVKTNEKGSRLEGAKFKLVHYAEDGTTKVDEKEISTDSNGELSFEKLVVGHWYTVEEVEAPDGYKLPAKRSTLKFRAEAIPMKNSYAISYSTVTLDKTNNNNETTKESEVKKLTKEGIVQDGVSFDADEENGTMSLEFDFVNNTWQKLPVTGSFTGIGLMSVALVIVIGSTVFYIKKRKA
jgi:LPXTG-motif cell wall anchor domain protein